MTKERKTFEILSILDRKNRTLTSNEITEELRRIGIHISRRRVIQYLDSLDYQEFTENFGIKGRRITEKGRKELKKTYIHARTDFIFDKIIRLITETTFDIDRQKGDVIVNLSFIQEDKEQKVLGILKEICSRSNLASPFIKIAYAGEKVCNLDVPEGEIGLVTISSVTIEEILLNNRIYVNPLYGGLIEFVDQKPVRFTELFSYEGSSIDPLDLLISRRMGTVYNAIMNNYGEVLADYREISYVARTRAIELLKRMVDLLGGLIVIGRTGVDIFGLHANEGYTGIVGFGGELLLSALEECNIQTKARTVDTVINFKELKPISEVKGEILEPF